MSGHTNFVMSVAFSPDGDTLASGSVDNTVRLWSVASRATLATLSGHTGAVFSVAFSPDGATLASGSDDKSVRLWSVASRATVATLSGHTADVWSVAFSPDGATLAYGSWDDTVRLWSVASSTPRAMAAVGTAAPPRLVPPRAADASPPAPPPRDAEMEDLRREMQALKAQARGRAAPGSGLEGARGGKLTWRGQASETGAHNTFIPKAAGAPLGARTA